LLDQDVETGLQAPRRDREVGGDGGGDGHRVEGNLEELVERRHPSDVPVVAGDGLQPLRIRVADRHHLGEGAGGEVADEVRPPVARADDGDLESAHGIPDQMMSANPRSTRRKYSVPAAKKSSATARETASE